MGGRRRSVASWERERAGPSPGAVIQRVTAGAAAPTTASRSAATATTATASSAVLGGLDPGRLPGAVRAAAFAGLGAAAGNRAVASLVSEVRADFPLGPPEGIRQIRAIGRGGTLGHTRLAFDPTAPLFRLPAPTAVENGFEVKPGRTRAPDLSFEVRWPTAGRHVLYEGRNEEGAAANTYLEVSEDWSTRIANGENEHVQDQTIAWQATWQKVVEVTNRLADGPPARGDTAEAARRASWSQFVDALPPLLKPAGQDPSDDAQLARWGWEPPTSAFRRLIGESKQARDISQWHTPDANLDRMDGPHEVRRIAAGSSRLPGPLPTEVMEAAWNRLEGEVGGGSGGGGRRRRGGRR